MSERCEACGHANPNGAKFCNECASPLLAASPDSGGRGYTPRHLADKILTMRAALEGERKQVTVLFVDVQGSMDLQEKVGDEAWHRIIDQFFKLTADSIHGHEGTINQYTGDGVMALFGAPIAHEDHARRACLSALQIREGVIGFSDKLVAEHGVGFSVRMGLNSGEVVVGRIGDDLRMDYTAQGQTVGLAARMEGLARPGRILLTLHTRNQVDGLFRLNDRGDTRVKGVSRRVQVFELVEERAAQSRFDVERSRGLGQFVGRDTEFKRLASLLGRAVKGRGQVVGICAEAGLGKSRLCYEFGRHCRDQGMPVYEVRGVSHARAVPLLAFREFFQGFFALDTNASPEQMRETVATKLTALDPELEAFTMLMLDFLNVGSGERSSRQDPEQRQEQLLELMQRMIRAGGLRQPGVIILENLQWLEDDDISRLFLDQLVAEVVSSRVLLIMTFRPEYEVRWSRKRHFSQIELGALDDESMKLLLAGLVGSDDTASELESVLCPRASGNPLFMEEMLRSLESSGALQRRRDSLRLTAPVNEIELPAGVQAMISARIDTLPEHSKYLLQTAAVVGKRFPVDVLRDVTHLTEKQLGEALQILDDADFVYQSAAKPEVQYAFRQSLAMEVAYRSQLGERRRDTHHAVAQALIDRYPKRIDQNAVVIAAHFESAGDTLLAADWCSRAAEWSAKADIRESLKRWRRVRDLLEDAELSPEVAALELRAVARFIHLGGRHGLAADELDSWVEFGFAALERCADPRLHAYFLMAVGASELFSGQCSAGSERYREADEAAAKSNDPGIRLVTSIGHVFGEMLAGRLDEALEICEHAIEAGDRVIDEGVDFLGRSPYVNLLGMHAWLLAQRADLGSALRQAKRTLRFGRRRREPEHQALAEIVLAMVASESGDPESAIEHGQRASEIATTTGNALVGTYAEMALGRAQLLLQDYSAARDTIEAIRGRMEESGHGRHEEGRILALLSEARAGLGDMSRARAMSRDSVKAARRCGNRIAEAEAHLAVAYAGLVGGRQLRRSTTSREALVSAAELIETTGARYLKPRLLELQSLAAAAFGDNETAQAAVSEAVDCLRAMGASARIPAMEERLRALQAAD